MWSDTCSRTRPKILRPNGIEDDQEHVRMAASGRRRFSAHRSLRTGPSTVMARGAPTQGESCTNPQQAGKLSVSAPVKPANRLNRGSESEQNCRRSVQSELENREKQKPDVDEHERGEIPPEGPPAASPADQRLQQQDDQQVEEKVGKRSHPEGIGIRPSYRSKQDISRYKEPRLQVAGEQSHPGCQRDPRSQGQFLMGELAGSCSGLAQCDLREAAKTKE